MPAESPPNFVPQRVLAWERMRWGKAQGPAVKCARCPKMVRHGVVRQGTARLFWNVGTRSKFRILCDACYRLILQLPNGMTTEVEESLPHVDLVGVEGVV